MELAAGRVEGALLVFRAVVDQWAALLVDHLVQKPFGSDLSEGRVFVQVADDLAAQQPNVVHVLSDGLRGKTR